MSQLTVEAIRSKLEAVNTAVRNWDQDPASTVTRWRGRQVRLFPLEVVEALHDLFDTCETMDATREAKSLALKVDAIDEALMDWAEGRELAPENFTPEGSPQIFDALVAANAHKDRRPREVEPIKSLLAQKVGIAQIAKMYGWKRDDGSADIRKVEEEIANPGTHYDPVTYAEASMAKYWSDIDAKWHERAKRVQTTVAAREVREAPESIDELIEQQVPSKQIASMKRVTVEEVKARAAELGIPLDGQFVRRVSPIDRLSQVREEEADQKAELEAMMAEELVADSHPEIEDLTERVLACFLDGLTHQQIAKAISADTGEKLSYQKVGKIIRDAEEAVTN